MSLISQDIQEQKGRHINICDIDTILSRNIGEMYPHAIILLDSTRNIIKISGAYNYKKSWPHTKDIAVNLKSPKYIRTFIDIPPSKFIRLSIWNLTLTVLLSLTVISTLIYLLATIKDKKKIIDSRELVVNGIIHDLKSPLNSVITLLSIIKADIKDNELRTCLELSEDKARQLTANIEEILLAARGTTHKIALKKEAVNLLALAEEAKSDIDITFSDKPHCIEITNKMSDNIIVYADSMYMQNVLHNLIENAVKYSDNNVKIKITLENNVNWAFVSVQDTGWGIQKKHQKHLFDQFYRIPTQTENVKGFGIGLALSKYIIKSHGGDIKLESKKGEGSTFIFKIPLQNN